MDPNQHLFGLENNLPNLNAVGELNFDTYLGEFDDKRDRNQLGSSADLPDQLSKKAKINESSEELYNSNSFPVPNDGEDFLGLETLNSSGGMEQLIRVSDSLGIASPNQMNGPYSPMVPTSPEGLVGTPQQQQNEFAGVQISMDQMRELQNQQQQQQMLINNNNNTNNNNNVQQITTQQISENNNQQQQQQQSRNVSPISEILLQNPGVPLFQIGNQILHQIQIMREKLIEQQQYQEQKQSLDIFTTMDTSGFPFDPQNTPSLPSQQLLLSLNTILLTIKEQLVPMTSLQKQFFIQLQNGILNQQEEANYLSSNQQIIQTLLQEGRICFIELESYIILLPDEISKLHYLQQEWKILSAQIDIYVRELTMITTKSPQISKNAKEKPFAALVITEQPFPMVITKGKPLDEDPISVKFLCGASCNITEIQPCKAVLIVDYQTTKNSKTLKKKTEIGSQDFDEHGNAKFVLKFQNGTRKNPENLRFQISIIDNGIGYTIESEESSPFIVITNESQYEESDGTLLKKDCFLEQNEIPWKTFANRLQRQFLRATRQDPLKPSRFLSLKELFYFNQKFFNSQNLISPTNFDVFWQWFGKPVQKLRYQRHIGPLWQMGLIYGFISREGVEKIVQTQQPGSFLIRFSERHPGLFAVGYKIEHSEKIQHYLIGPEDIGAKKTLPDFLRERNEFARILQVSTDNNSDARLQNYKRDLILDQYYSKRPQLQDVEGYVTSGGKP